MLFRSPENYSVDISALAKETGQRPPTPPPVKRDTSESEGEEEEGKKVEGEGAGGAGKGGKNSKVCVSVFLYMRSFPCFI